MAVQAQHHYHSPSDHFLSFPSFSAAPQDWSWMMMEAAPSGSNNNNGGFINDDLSQSLQQPQQYHHQQDLVQNQQRNYQFLGQVVDPPPSNNNLASSMGFSPQSSFAVQVEKQRQEIDGFIAFQNERLRIALQEQRKQQQVVLLKRLESKTMRLVRQKDNDLAKAKRKTKELLDCIRKAEIEKQAWQTVAKDNESMVIALNNTLEQVRENVCCLAIGTAEDAESCCCESHPSVQESKGEKDHETKSSKKMSCKGCNIRKSCVLFLPCRHLCSCKSCESLLDYCPVCKSVKKACIDVFMS